MDEIRNEIDKYYNKYVRFYNNSNTTIQRRISTLAELTQIEIAVKNHEVELDKKCQESLSMLIDLIKNIPGKDLNEHLMKTKNFLIKYLEHYDKNAWLYEYELNSMSYIVDQIYLLIDGLNSNEYGIKIDVSRAPLIMLQPKLLRVQSHRTALKYVAGKIIDQDYPKNLPLIDELTDNEKSAMRSNGNADKLSIANDWLFSIITAITSLEEPTHEMVLDIIQKEFPEFKHVPGKEDLSFIKGLNNINKSSIDKALRYLFNEKYDDNIAEGTIRSKFNKYGMW